MTELVELLLTLSWQGVFDLFHWSFHNLTDGTGSESHLQCLRPGPACATAPGGDARYREEHGDADPP